MVLQQCFTQAPSTLVKAIAQRLRSDRRSEQGSALIEFALMLPILALLLAGAVDFARAWYVNLEVAAAAEAGALYGVQNPSDTSGITAAAALDALDLANLQVSVSAGNECSDGTSPVPFSGSFPSCGVNSVEFVEVDTSAAYKPILRFPGIASSYTMAGRSRMRSSGE